MAFLQPIIIEGLADQNDLLGHIIYNYFNKWLVNFQSLFQAPYNYMCDSIISLVLVGISCQTKP